MPTKSTRRAVELKRELAIKRMDECLVAGVAAKEDNRQLPTFLSRYSKLESYCSSFESHHLKICSEYASDDEVDQEDAIRHVFDDKYFRIIEIHTSLTSGAAQRDESATDSSDRSVKLPRLNLPTFDGDIKTWGTFYDMYHKMVHQNKKVSNIERFSILISLLRDEPLQLIKGFPLSETNYTDAYAALIDRYQCKRKIAFRHWEELNTIQANTSSPRELRRLVDTFKENLAVLKNLKLPAQDWDFPLFYMLINKLDVESRRRFELQNSDGDIPSFQSLLNFLEKAGQALELAEPDPKVSAVASRTARTPSARESSQPSTYGRRSPRRSTTVASLIVSDSTSGDNIVCPLCKSQHPLSQCLTYRSHTPQDRFVIVKDNNLCVNCLRPGHVVKRCPSKFRCQRCNVPHHTTLHFDNDPGRAVSNTSSASSAVPSSARHDIVASPVTANVPKPDTSSNRPRQSGQPSVTLIADLPPTSRSSLLATASVEVLDGFGCPRKMRIVIDNGSQVNFITKKCADRLCLPFNKQSSSVVGIGQAVSNLTNSTTYRIRIDGGTEIAVEAFVIPKICGEMPCYKIDVTRWPPLHEVKLADPNFHLPGPIDALVGVDMFCEIFLGERLECAPNGPTAFNTRLGWIVMGKIENAPTFPNASLVCSSRTLDDQIRRFWEVEDLPKASPLSQEDALCESIFVATHTRDNNGRYVVCLPFKSPNPSFGDSHSLAYRRLLSLERRLSRDPNLRENYNAFMQDYLDAGHMELTSEPRTEKTYYIPHHCVLKPSSTTTKLRVVFDATARPPNGPSLNEQLLVGPKLQSDIGSILLRFRLHAVVFTADMRQMYRQILVSPTDRDYQRILFRFSPNDPIREYRLKTVTYGMSSSSYLALRTILQVAKDEGSERPLAVATLSNAVYVDDVVSGLDSLDSTRELINQVIEVLGRGCFELRKWASNCPALLKDIPPEHLYDSNLSFDAESNAPVKVLGLEWVPSKDVFAFKTSLLYDQCTKRHVLSELARIFDPLGFLTPFTFALKCTIQKLWSLGLDWDDTAPEAITQLWSRYRSNLELLSSLDVPRYIPALKAKRLEVHGFCDASTLGFAAVVYFRIIHVDDHIATYFVMSRSKVAPTKTVSVPRLELCAAVLLTDLIDYIRDVYKGILSFDSIYCWSDSTVTLAWLRSPSSRWKTYVSNRVSRIQDSVPPSCWRHVSSQDNPSDCASRGLSVRDLIDHSLWRGGPSWLLNEKDTWPSPTQISEDSLAVSERRTTHASLFVAINQFEDFLAKYSSLKRIQRIVAYVIRFAHNCRNPSSHKTGHLIESELNEARQILLKMAQSVSFAEERDAIEKGKAIPKALRKLQPFIDKYGIIRVGGRLTHSELDYDCKHPVLLSRTHRLTSLIIDQTHHDHQHPGLRTLSFLLAQNYWILAPRRAINSRLAKCIKCFRTNPKPITPRMADLPKFRISQIKPFSVVGVDFAGPFSTYIQRYRGSRTFKTYICIFVCFATKATHIELVDSLSTDAFLNALRRFIARRGRCRRIHCDRGTNFVGAHNILSPLMQQAAASEAIEFAFNPPAASHFGGLWEIGVKSFKTHLSRVIGDQILTYDEFLTIIAQIEALLNSRPLCEAGSDPNDMSALTPGHFLTLEPLTSLPESRDSDPNFSTLSRWRLMQRLHRDFWNRWHVEYLHTLNQRAKWHVNAAEPKVGTMVLIKDEQQKPLHWALGRIAQLHHGRDGVARVATVKTQSGHLQRPLVKLCPLPLD